MNRLLIQNLNKSIFYWLISGCLLIFLMVLIGGITRLTNSGLSMVEWKLIMGIIPPLNEAQWLEIFDKYKQFPEYQLVNTHFTLDEFKSIFFWEYLHRLLGRIIGLVFIIPFIYFLLKKRLSKKMIIQCVILLGMGALQGFFGWWMVESGLNKDPDVSHFRLAIHLVTAFLTFAYTFWVALGLLTGLNEKNIFFPSLRNSFVVLLIVLIIQIVYGAFVAGLNAGFLMNTWPKMENQWINDAVFAISPLWKNFTEGLAGVQFIHRYVAVIVVAMVVFIWFKAAKFDISKIQLLSLKILLSVVFLQFLLGVFTLVYAVPVWLGVVHQIGAFLLLAATVFGMFVFKRN
ncbi:MAG: heme A synthase [Flavobacteriales bacterium]|nr:heme A synthase [Flavobacteriales bacterium]